MLSTCLNRVGILFALLLSVHSYAGDVATVTLDNGATVILKDDFTWEYVVISPTAADTNQTSVAVNPSASPTQKLMDNKTLLQSGLLTSAANRKVTVQFKQAQWDGERVGLDFELTSNNRSGVVLVEVEVTFYDDAGRMLDTQTVNAWQASFRLPDSYLRNGQTRPSRTVWVDGIDSSQWKNQLLSLRVRNVETR